MPCNNPRSFSGYDLRGNQAARERASEQQGWENEMLSSAPVISWGFEWARVSRELFKANIFRGFQQDEALTSPACNIFSRAEPQLFHNEHLACCLLISQASTDDFRPKTTTVSIEDTIKFQSWEMVPSAGEWRNGALVFRRAV